MAGFGGSITGMYGGGGVFGEGANEMGNRPNHDSAWLRRHTKEGKNVYVYSKASLVSHKRMASVIPMNSRHISKVVVGRLLSRDS